MFYFGWISIQTWACVVCANESSTHVRRQYKSTYNVLNYDVLPFKAITLTSFTMCYIRKYCGIFAMPFSVLDQLYLSSILCSIWFTERELSENIACAVNALSEQISLASIVAFFFASLIRCISWHRSVVEAYTAIYRKQPTLRNRQIYSEMQSKSNSTSMKICVFSLFSCFPFTYHNCKWSDTLQKRYLVVRAGTWIAIHQRIFFSFSLRAVELSWKILFDFPELVSPSALFNSLYWVLV